MKKGLEMTLFASWIVIMGINAFIVFGHPSKSHSEASTLQILNESAVVSLVTISSPQSATAVQIKEESPATTTTPKPSEEPVEQATPTPGSTPPPKQMEPEKPPVNVTVPVSQPSETPSTTPVENKPDPTPEVTTNPDLVESSNPRGEEKPESNPDTNTDLTSKPSDVKPFVEKLVGIKYKWGGTTVKAFDTSGFVQYVLSKFGIDVPRTTAQMRNLGIDVARAEDLQELDLVFFRNNDQDTGGSYVGLSVGNNKVAIVTMKHGVSIVDMQNQMYWKEHFVIGKRLK